MDRFKAASSRLSCNACNCSCISAGNGWASDSVWNMYIHACVLTSVYIYVLCKSLHDYCTQTTLEVSHNFTEVKSTVLICMYAYRHLLQNISCTQLNHEHHAGYSLTSLSSRSSTSSQAPSLVTIPENSSCKNKEMLAGFHLQDKLKLNLGKGAYICMEARHAPFNCRIGIPCDLHALIPIPHKSIPALEVTMKY